MLAKFIFPNVYEVVRRSMPWRTFDSTFKQKLRNAGLAYSELGLLWGGDNKIVVLPKPIPSIQIDYITSLLGYKNIELFTYENNQEESCYFSQQIKNYLERFFKNCESKSNRSISCSFWGASPEAYSLITQMQSMDIRIEYPDIPRKYDYRQVELFDSKSKFRDFLSSMGMIFDSFGYTIATSYEEVPSILQNYIKKQIPCVVKAEFGIGGYGNIFLNDKILKSGYNYCIKKIEAAVIVAPYISSSELIFEKTLNNNQFGSETISGLAQVRSDGTCNVLGVVREIRVLGYYRGAQTVSDITSRRIANITREVGTAMSAKGYRGFFCIDCIVSKENRIFLLEINARRCASHYIFEVGDCLFNSEYFAKHYLSLPITILKKTGDPVEITVDIFNNITKKENEIFAVPSQVMGLTDPAPYIGFLVLGRNQISVESTYKKIVAEFKKSQIIIGETG